MELSRFERNGEYEWHIVPHGAMRVPGVIFASEALVRDMDDKVYEQVVNVATLPGIVKASYAMPDAHWGYGFPIGGVAAFDPARGGIISAGGVGFDISCGVRLLHTGLHADDITARKDDVADTLFVNVPAGVGSTGSIRLNDREMAAMLTGGARWAVKQGYGGRDDLEHVEEHGCVSGADAEMVSARAKDRQRDEMGTLGSGNHYLEVQRVTRVHDTAIAAAYGLAEGDAVISIHCGSRGLGHQIGTEFLREMAMEAPRHGIRLPDRELACAPLESELGRRYLGAMRAGINCALANRQVLTQIARDALARVFPQARLTILYDVSHNTCKEEVHELDGVKTRLFVHRKGATRAFGPGDPTLPEAIRAAGQPVLIGGTMGTASYVLAGTRESETRAFGSACHGAGRAMSRKQATKRWHGRDIVTHLAERGIIVRSPSLRGIAEEAPGAYKDVTEVVEAADRAGLARIVARLEPMVCIKG